MNDLRSNVTAIFGTITTSAGAVASWSEHLDRALSITASVVAIVVGLLTIRSIFRKSTKP